LLESLFLPSPLGKLVQPEFKKCLAPRSSRCDNSAACSNKLSLQCTHCSRKPSHVFCCLNGSWAVLQNLSRGTYQAMDTMEMWAIMTVYYEVKDNVILH